MRRVALILLVTATAAAGCRGGSAGSGPVRTSRPLTQVEITYFAGLRPACPTNDPCGSIPFRRIECPRGSRCVLPVAQAELIRCPRGARQGLHCYAIPATLSRGPRPDPWVILQQRELSCSPARGGYADPAAACRALADYLRRARSVQGTACMCPAELWPDAATGAFRGRRVRLDLSACAMCGLGSAAMADRDALMPPLGS
jgi:hypothetical protein